jgi:hypothetical protein
VLEGAGRSAGVSLDGGEEPAGEVVDGDPLVGRHVDAPVAHSGPERLDLATIHAARRTRPTSYAHSRTREGPGGGGGEGESPLTV